MKKKSKRRYIRFPSDRNYDDPQYKKWRLDVYKRDHFKCRWPGCQPRGTRGKVHAHHIMKWADYPHLRFNLSNGITLCRKHHDMIKGREDEFIGLFRGLLL